MRFLPFVGQALAVLIIVFGPRGRPRFDGLGVQFVIYAAIYHGLTEALQTAFPLANIHRDVVNADDVEGWLWIVSGAMLAFSCAYVAASRLSTERQVPVPTPAPLVRPWFWLLVTVPIYLYTVVGAAGDESYWAGGLAQNFILLSVVITAVAFIQAGASPVLMFVIQTAAVSLLASRLSVISCAVMLSTALYATGRKIRFREVAISGLLVVFVVLTISLARASVGREQLNGGMADRADGIVKGGGLLASGNGGEDLVDSFVYRFDGNTYPAMIRHQLGRDHEPAGPWPFINDLWVAIPRFLNPDKLDSDVTRRNDVAYINAWFGFPDLEWYVPTQLGVLFGATGMTLFPFVVALIGALVERIDRRLSRLRSADGLILKMALCQANVFMESGFIVYTVALRGALFLIVLLRLAAWAGRVAQPLTPATVVSEPHAQGW
jgi:hypothetical protein